MKELSQIASAVRASTTLAIDAMFKQMKADGIDVIGFGAGEPDFHTPDNIKEAGYAAIRDNFTCYTPTAGIPEFMFQLRSCWPAVLHMPSMVPSMPWLTPVMRSLSRHPSG